MGGWAPPRGSLAIPHPRSVPDIILRSAAIHVFASIAYANLLYLVPALSRRSQRSVPQTPSSRWQHLLRLAGYPIFFAFLPPIFLTTHLALRLLLPLVLQHESAADLTSVHLQLPAAQVLSHGVIAVVSALPLMRALAGYRTRLAMRYHEAFYVGNLGLDHRNGWIAASGLTAGALTVLVVGMRVLTGRNDTMGSESDSEIDEKSVEQRDERASETNSTLSSWAPLAEAGITALAEQPLLIVTNHWSSLRLLLRHWHLLLVGGGLLLALHKRRGWRAELMAKVAVAILVVANIVMHLGWDALELWDAARGRVREYNYRWGVRDDFSARIWSH